MTNGFQKTGDKIGHFSHLVMLPHSVFALPFALTAVVLASYSYEVTITEVVLIVIAFTAARSAAFGVNRLVDHDIDTRNPRTRNRPLPARTLSRFEAWTFVAGSIAVFEVCAWLLGRLPLLLSPVALAVIIGYSWTKYFTPLAHIILGLSLAIAPVGAWIAVTDQFGTGVMVLAGAVICWVAGFDIIYALQDEHFDREEGLYSIPARLGAGGALLVSRGLHALSAGLFICTGFFFPVGVYYWVACGACTLMLVFEHSLVSADDISRVNAAFFTANGVVSVLFFLMNLVDRLA